MKKLFLLFIAFFAFTSANSQVLQPVKWTSKTEKISETEYNLIVSGKLDEGWHLYSQYTPEGGSLPMVLTFESQKGNYELVGKAKESHYEKKYSDVWELDEYFFEKSFTLTQKIKILNPKTEKIKLNLEYQVCKQACINDKKNFVFEISKKIEEVKIIPTQIIDSSSTEILSPIKFDTIKKEVVIPKQIPPNRKKTEDKSLWTIFIFAFLGGFAALLTPCVFPMIPMTVSFFTKQSKTKSQGIRNAIFYGLSIIGIYVVLGLGITAIFGAGALNSLASNVWFNLIFFVILLIFAASFLGAFEIMLPNSWANKIDKQADKGGVLGILFMALALAIVSFSCTGPIVGTLLVQAASKGGIAPIVGMFGFSLALALPFMLFAMFPGWLQSLPKSGSWLNTVKVSLGFLELAFAFKFLSNVDLVLQLHWFERETFLAIWIAVFGVWSLYLLGKINLPNDSGINHISVSRLFFAITVLAFTFYLIPGLFGAPLKLISGFPPPQKYSESPNGFFQSPITKNLPEGAEIGPNNIVVFTDYEKGLIYAKLVNKPILLDFTGHTCTNCRLMENNVWSDEKVLKILKNEVVLISLFADDKRNLPEKEQFISKKTGSMITTIGDKWTDFMISKYNTNTQPLYVLTDLNGENLNSENPTTSYNPDIKLYENWLKTGISNFKK